MAFLIRYGYLLSFIAAVNGCTTFSTSLRDDGLTILSQHRTGISFANRLTESDSLNLLTYYYFYNGSGVAAGDLNNDGMEDLVFGGNMVSSEIYLNKGGLEFSKLSTGSGFYTSQWIMGVSLVDINVDGWLDIYLSVAGPGCNDDCPNLLFINQGPCQDAEICFVESALAYGLDDPSFSVHAAFFDYDKDNDLDVFLLTNIVDDFNKAVVVKSTRAFINEKRIDRLYRNDWDSVKGHPVFRDVSNVAGIHLKGYGLGVAIEDINQDGWPDIYIANDFMDSDILYINERDGSFVNEAENWLNHQSYNGMGVDIADLNNDALPDIGVLDMLPMDNLRRKLMITSIQEENELLRLESGYAKQYIRNTLQLHRGRKKFSEIGQLSGIAATDWSWAILMADLTNDSFKDILISNGIVKDMTDLDFIQYRSSETFFGSEGSKKEKLSEMVKNMKTAKLPNYFFANNQDLTFTNLAMEWGVDLPSYSTGMIYSDLDNDGDLDVVVNNIDERAFVYENRSTQPDHHYITISLTGPRQNLTGIGTKVFIYHGGRFQYYYQSLQRGYLSSVSPKLHIGLGEHTTIDSLRVVWPDDSEQTIYGIAADQTFSITYQHAEKKDDRKKFDAEASPLFEEISGAFGIDFVHHENAYNDFKVSPLLLHKYSNMGPGIAVGDVNADGLEDFFIGGAAFQEGCFYIQTRSGNFRRKPFSGENEFEDLGALLFDADNDDDLDLYVVSGGSDFHRNFIKYQDRLYRNDGMGNFSRDEHALPAMHVSGSCVVAADYDRDGDLDLFVGGRVTPGSFPVSPESFLLENQNGTFKDVTAQLIGKDVDLGMVTAALWSDVNNDGVADLVIAAEWQPVRVFIQHDGIFAEQTVGLDSSKGAGWWNSLFAIDANGDRQLEYVAGNHGLNSRFHATHERPIRLYAKDFDDNGQIDPIVTHFNEDVEYVYHPGDALFSQIPGMHKRFSSYSAYAQADFNSTFLKQELHGAQRLEATLLSSSLLSMKDGQMSYSPLFTECQFGPVIGIASVQLPGGRGIALSGNFYAAETGLGPYDAFKGEIIQVSKGSFERLNQTGFWVDADTRSLATLQHGNNHQLLLSGINNGPIAAFKTTYSPKGRFVALKPLDFYAEIQTSSGEFYKEEFYYGMGYLSQSSRYVFLPSNTTKAVVYAFNGKKRTIALNH